MKLMEATATALVVGILAVSFAFTPLALATASSPRYPSELTGRQEYVAPQGTSSPLVSAERTSIVYEAPAVTAVPFVWVQAPSYTTSPGHGL